MTHIVSNLSGEYKNIIENLENELDDDIYMFSIERIWYVLSDKYDRINSWSNQNKGKYSEKPLYICQVKDVKVNFSRVIVFSFTCS